jgi:RecJ-like exonuclease
MASVTCPMCQGTGMYAAGNEPHKTVIWGYDPVKDELPCPNCKWKGNGGYKPEGSGKTLTRSDGTPCIHSYKATTIGKNYRRYVCIHGCGDVFTLDSGD